MVEVRREVDLFAHGKHMSCHLLDDGSGQFGRLVGFVWDLMRAPRRLGCETARRVICLVIPFWDVFWKTQFLFDLAQPLLSRVLVTLFGVEFGFREDLAPVLAKRPVNLLGVREQLTLMLECVDARLCAWEQVIESALVPFLSRREVGCIVREALEESLLLQRLCLGCCMYRIAD